MTALLIAFLTSPAGLALMTTVLTTLTNRIIRKLPIKPNDVIDLVGHVAVNVGQAIVDRGNAGAPAAPISAAPAPAPVVQNGVTRQAE